MITFKSLEEKDSLFLQKWLNVDFVTKWYERKKFLYDDVEREYFVTFKRDTPIESYITHIDGKPIGYVHTYRVHDYPDYALCLLVDRTTYGMDMFIGDQNYIGKGYGSKIIEAFVKDVVFRKSSVTSCITSPDPRDKNTIRVYEKAGFSFVKSVKCEGKDEYMMRKLKTAPQNVIFTHQ